ncbi:MAG TPA: hypothetical protein PKE33_11985 [Kiritimatiellia bacterium]|nr:hypothetical protein [Kiritimatiellia bacterium]
MNAAPSTPWLDRLLAGLFALALVLPALFLKPDLEAAAGEKRTLAPAPSLPRDAKALAAFPEAFDAWFADHFGFRSSLIKAHARFSFFALHTSPSPKVFRGRDGFVFLKGTPAEDGDPIADLRGTAPLSPYELERWRWQLEDQHAWLRDRGIGFLYAVIPGKERMNRAHLPAGYAPVNPGAYDQFVAHIAPRATYPFVPLEPTLAAAAPHSLLYRKTDTHWNDAGAWAAAFALTDTLRLLAPVVPRITPADLSFRVVDYREGDMGNMLGLPGETFERLVEIRRTASELTVFPLTDHPLGDIVTTTPDERRPRAVLFHDSFGHYLKPWFGEYFRWLRFRWSNAGIDTSVIAASEPEWVIHLMAERRIRMGQRYEMSVQQHGNRDRFHRATTTAASWNPSSGFDALATAPDVTAATTPDGFTLTGQRRAPAFTLPLPDATTNHLPVLRIEATVETASELMLGWTGRDGNPVRDVKGPLPAGRHSVYLPLLDPDASGPLHLELVRGAGAFTIHDLSIRLIAR